MERALLEYLLSQGYDSTAAKFAEELAAKDPRMKRRASLRWTHAQRRGLGWDLSVARGTGDMYCALFADELPEDVRARIDMRRLESEGVDDDEEDDDDD